MARFQQGTPVPDNAHPLVKRLVMLMNEHKIEGASLCREAGVAASSIHAWRKRNNPNIASFEAVLNALGYQLIIRRRDDL